MVVLGISGRDRDAAAALAVDGKVVSAVAEESLARIRNIGYAQTGGFPGGAVRACLDRAGLEAADVEQVVVVDDGPARPAAVGSAALRGVPMREVAAVRADALHAAMVTEELPAVLVCGADPAGIAVFHRADHGLGPRTDVPGSEDLARAARKLCGLLGLSTNDPFAALDRLSAGAAPVFQDGLSPLLQAKSDLRIDVRLDDLAPAVERIAGPHAASLSHADSLNTKLHDMRRELAASFTCQLAKVVADIISRVGDASGGARLAAGGALFGNARFNTELGGLANGAVAIARVPEALGRAVGAVASDPAVQPAGGVALGPSFSEEDIKRTLDNCRLDYVYEPDWPRLLVRVSRMLAQGKIVGWFQGAMAFGPRALGTRSILADPSNRYARQNVNEYLRQRPVDEPLPLALAPSMASQCLVSTGPATGVRDVAVQPEWRQALAGALDAHQAARVHAAPDEFEPQLRELLEQHHAATGTPGLIEVNLAGPGEPVACAPRDAVRTVYSSAIDALVIGRFLLMKDYWLLRGQS